METITPKLTINRHLIMIGVGALCAGIIIGFKLAGGEKVTLQEHPAGSNIVIEPEPNEVEND